jgi:hypothetical protein
VKAIPLSQRIWNYKIDTAVLSSEIAALPLFRMLASWGEWRMAGEQVSCRRIRLSSSGSEGVKQ